MYYSPLEQFKIIPILPIYIGFVDISLTNSFLIMVLSVGAFMWLARVFYNQDQTTQVLGSFYQSMFEGIYSLIISQVYENVGEKGRRYFPFVFALFSFVMLMNLVGLIPYSFTVTSHLIVTFALAFMIFVGVTLICVEEHQLKALRLFLPSGTSLALALILVPIEIVSYVFKPISLSVRLFANMVAGHTLLKVIAGSAAGMMTSGGFLLIGHFIPILVLFLLMGLEFAVACIQTYVFTILTCIYINDAKNLH